MTVVILGTDLKAFRGLSGDKCRNVVDVESPILGRTIKQCESFVPESSAENDIAISGLGKQKRGRPKGSTRKSGAKRPSVPVCKEFRTVRGKRGRKICMCSTKGNNQIQSNNKCGLPSRNH